MKKVMFFLVAIMMVSMSFTTSAQSIDSVKINYLNVDGLNPSTQVRVGVGYFGVLPYGIFRILYQDLNGNIFSTPNLPPVSGTDTTSYVVSGLTPATFYSIKIVFSLPVFMESVAVGYTTTACPFVPNFSDEWTSICKHTLTASPDGGTYQWTIGGIPFSSAQTVSVNLSGSYTLFVTLGGCQASVTKEVEVPGIVVNVIADKSIICFGESIKLNAVVVNPTGNETFSWTSTPAGFTSNEQNPTVIPTVTTTYKVVVSDGSCSVTATVKITVNKNNTIVTLTSAEDTLCNNSVHPIPLNGLPSGGTYGGQWVAQNYFYPDTSFFGTSVATYIVTDINGCTAVAEKTFYVISSLKVIKVSFVGKTLQIDGWFPYPIEIKINGTTYYSTEQNNSVALFDNVPVKEGDGVIIKSSIGGCFILYEFHFGLGIEEMNPNSFIMTGTAIDIYTTSGVKIRTVVAPRELRSDNEMDVLLKDLLPNGVYLWYANSGRTKGKSMVYHW